MNKITITVDGVKYGGWQEVSVKKSIEDFCGTFSFKSSSLNGEPFPVKSNQKCQIAVNDILVMTGWVEKINVRLSDTHEITISGRDQTNDIVDSQLSGSLNTEFRPPVTLKQIITQILKDLNLTNISVIDRFNLKAFQTIKQNDVGSTAFEFIEQFAKARQVLLTTNGDGNIQFERASADLLKTVISMQRDRKGIALSSNVRYDESQRFHKYTASTQGSNSSYYWFGKFVKPEKAVNIASKDAVDNGIRDSRIYFFQPDDNDNETTTNTDRASWEANFRRAQAMKYNCTIQGFSPPDDANTIWQPNKLVHVIDEFADIDSILLITSITYVQSLDRGSIVRLELMTKDAFTLEVNKPQKDKTDSNEGSNIFGVK